MFITQSIRQPHTQLTEAASYNYQRASKDKVKATLRSINWNQCIKFTNQYKDVATQFYDEIIKSLKSANVPKYKNLTKNNCHTSNLIRDLQNEMFKHGKHLARPDLRTKNRNEIDEKIQTINTKIQYQISKEELDKESKLLKEIANNPKAFYKHADKSRKMHTRIGPLKVADQYVSDPKAMADILSKQYENVFSAPKEDLSYYKSKIIETAKLTDLEITTDDVINAIKEINNDSAPGPDGIPVVFYKDYAEELAYPLSLIWRPSIDTGE